jgi:hypothetical protein
MERSEAKSAVKALYLQSAAIAGMEVRPQSPERFADIVQAAFERVEPNRHARAVSSALRLIARTLELAEEQGVTMLGESDVDKASEDICPIYPFGEK